MTKEKYLYLHLDYKADEHGVYDGRDMSKELMETAYRLLATYADNSLETVEHLFKAISYETLINKRILLEEEDDDWVEGYVDEYADEEQPTVESQSVTMTVDFSDETERKEAITRHIKDTKKYTEALLVYPTRI
jgi:hypothetical protein